MCVLAYGAWGFSWVALRLVVGLSCKRAAPSCSGSGQLTEHQPWWLRLAALNAAECSSGVSWATGWLSWLTDSV